jgi:hypothetical protein
MTPEIQQQIEGMQRTINEMNTFISAVFNPDGTLKNPSLVIQPKDTAVTSATGSVRIETNLGPINVLIT